MRLPAEWERQSGIQLTWPDADTPWYRLDLVQECYVKVAFHILRHEPLLMVCRDEASCRADLGRIAASLALDIPFDNILFRESPLNDTWARDHGPIAVHGDGEEKLLLDFVFNGWGLKFASDLDNQITRRIYGAAAFCRDVRLVDMRPFVLEGGSIDTDGEGTMIATESCLCSLNRNEYLDRDGIEARLKDCFGLRRILWLRNGEIAGDDTDSHVDILARFCSPDTIAYTACDDPQDVNYLSLKAMEEQLRTFRTLGGKPYRLCPLPLPEPMYLDGYRLPASYANFLIINGAVLMPGVGSGKDAIAAEALQSIFPDREVVTIDCRPLLSGHGGLHCITMNYPEGWLEL